MKEKWLELTWPKRAILLLQGFLILLFLILYCTLGLQRIVWYGSSPLRVRTGGEVTTYSGKVNGQQAVFTVSPGPVVEYRLGDTLYGPYSILFDPSAVPDEENTPWNVTDPQELVGVEVRKGAEVLFRGAYLNTGNTLLLFAENGEWDPSGPLQAWGEISDGVYGWISESEPSVQDILQIAAAPQIVRRGHAVGFWMGAFCCVVCAVSLLYADELFRFHMSFRVRYPEDAEPSDWELFGRWVGWTVLPVVALVFFILGLSAA